MVETRPLGLRSVMGYSSAKTVVGLDIEPGYVAAVEARPGRVEIERAGWMPLASGVVRDGEVVDVEALAGTLKELFAQHKLGKRVRIGVANQRIVMRTIDLPPLENEKDVGSAVRFQAQEHIPMPLDQAVLEHHSLGQVETAEGRRTRVVLVAARRDMIERLLDAVRQAGLRPQGIDLSAFAMIRALHRPAQSGATLYMNVGGMTNLAVAAGSTCVFTRVVAHGTDSMAGELAERRGLTLEHSHAWLKHVGLTTPVEEIEGDDEIVADTRAALADGVRRIADDVRNSIDFHSMQQGAVHVELAVVTGPAVSIPGFSDQLGVEIALPLEVGRVDEAKVGASNGFDTGHLAVAAGLTVDEVPA